MKTKQLLIIGVATTLTLSSTLNVSAAGMQDLFNAKYYTEKYEDLNAAFGENDASATELITLSPPTGTVITAMLGLQVAAIALAAITILAGGIVIIKKKVLTK